MRSSFIALAGALAVGLAGCANRPELVPAAGDNALPAPEVGATASVSGVRMSARTDAWSGRPAALPSEFTPVLIHIRNHSGRRLMVRFRDFTLVSPSGVTYAAIPPFGIHQTVTIQRPYFQPYDFDVAPYLEPYYPEWSAYDGFPGFDSDYFGEYFPEFARIRLPTPDMLRAALPEGVLRPGGSLSGYVYFQHVGDRVHRVVLRERLETPNGRPFGMERIPFTNH